MQPEPKLWLDNNNKFNYNKDVKEMSMDYHVEEGYVAEQQLDMEHEL